MIKNKVEGEVVNNIVCIKVDPYLCLDDISLITDIDAALLKYVHP